MQKKDYNWQIIKYGEISVYYLDEIDGGGRDQSLQDYIPVVKELFGKVDTICEFGSGPGFIGFSLLANGLCDKLCLTDINPLAIEACNKTIAKNHLEKKVTTYVSDALDTVPSKEKWDLVVSNPPHFNGNYTNHPGDLILIDPDWLVHKKFYSKVSKHLTKGGSVLFVENSHGSSVSTFKSIITKNDLTIVKTFRHKHPTSKVVFENLTKIFRIFKNIRYLLSVLKRMSIKPSMVLLINKYPSYFIWSKLN